MNRLAILAGLAALAMVTPAVSASPPATDDPVEEAMELAARVLSGECYEGWARQTEPDPDDVSVNHYLDPHSGTLILVVHVPGVTYVARVNTGCLDA